MKNDLPERIRDRYSHFASEHPILATTIETIGGWTLDTIVFIAQDSESNHLSHIMDQRNQHPLKFDIMCSTFVPLVEELEYRTPSWLTSKIAPESKPLQLAIDVASSIRFAEIHRSKGDSFPMSHFFTGMHCARLARNRGLGHAILAHSIYNTCAALSQRATSFIL